MIWDKIFWVWFAVAAAALICIMLLEGTPASIYFALLLAGLGFLKLAEESKASKTISKRLLERLRK
jgi:hypothetical protein